MALHAPLAQLNTVSLGDKAAARISKGMERPREGQPTEAGIDFRD